MSQPHESKVYTRLLSNASGLALWHPEPAEKVPVKYRERGVSVGDVGVVDSDGWFDFLFNICLPSGHPINARGVPHDFENVWKSVEIVKDASFHPPGTTFPSSKILPSKADVSSSNNL